MRLTTSLSLLFCVIVGSVIASQETAIIYFDSLVDAKEGNGKVVFCYPTGAPIDKDFQLDMSVFLQKEMVGAASASRLGLSFDSNSIFYDVPLIGKDTTKPIHLSLRGKSGIKNYGFDPEVLMQKGVFVGALEVPSAYTVEKLGLEFKTATAPALVPVAGALDTCRAFLKEQGVDSREEPRGSARPMAWVWYLGAGLLCLLFLMVAVAITRRMKARAAQVDTELLAQEALEEGGAGNGNSGNTYELQSVPQYVATSTYVPSSPASPDETPQYAQMVPMYSTVPAYAQPVFYSVPYAPQPTKPSFGY